MFLLAPAVGVVVLPAPAALPMSQFLLALFFMQKNQQKISKNLHIIAYHSVSHFLGKPYFMRFCIPLHIIAVRCYTEGEIMNILREALFYAVSRKIRRKNQQKISKVCERSRSDPHLFDADFR